ncbi:hypothetical protein [Draconibacterium sediminis]|uniref:hypothetical protein n=1 Tax=Draconibacterium sediminis TaxID=1544798 RepID=UPI0012FA85E1|nr:hypothetical protein [Draconibacterium sediminis]
MKYFNTLGIILLAFIFTNCKDEGSVTIDSLSTGGDEFYTNQLVKLWMVVDADDLMDVTYEWGCEGGSLVQPQGLDEMTWKAPSTTGTYRVFCKVSSGGKSEIRYHDMYVSSFFFEKFENSIYSFKGQSSTKLSLKSETVDGKTNGYLEAYVRSTGSSNRYIYYNFGDPELKVPFSCMAKVGWKSDFPTDTVTVKSSVYANKMAYRLTLNRAPEYVDEKYIDDIRFEWFPVEGNGYPVDVETGQAFNGTLTFEENNMGSKTWYSVNFFAPELAFAKGEYKNVAVNMEEDYTISVFVGNAKVLETDALINWRTDNAAQDEVYIKEWRFVMVNGNGGNKAPKFYFDNAYATNDGTALP